ncbi:xaa-Pro aminopeptidase 1-like isoform X2 [Branchiostoma floridae]|uniref:Xaa-Pro aminopeptidase 1-like isoform X2 n=1 Tax=Branchiostoma floridae TaxID=7739 RepID=A0A9J7LQ52_BRAFL|nr:xaa-Pro aminopeptidase 1-like isoform X2 [Branchiostoma floridae]
MHSAIILLICAGAVFLVSGDPVSEGDGVHPRSPRVKRAPGDSERDCTATPPYIPPTAKDTTDLLRRLRQGMQSSAYFAGSIQAYIIPAGDAHLSEYISERDQRRAFISGLSGSSGTAVVTNDGSGGGKAAVWTDSRYFLQAEQQLDCNWILMRQYEEGVPTIVEWLVSELGPGGRVGIDPHLVSISTWQGYADPLEADGKVLIESSGGNLIDAIWDDRPPPSTAPLITQGLNYTGKSWEDKITDIREKMSEQNADALVLTKLDEVAWLVNLRGSDVPFNPVFFAYAIVTANTAVLYLDTNKVTDDVRSHLRLGCTTGVSCVQVEAYDTLLSAVEALAADSGIRKIWISSASTTYAVFSKVPESKQILDASPVMKMKSKKNAVEQQGLKNAHIRDAVAKCEYLMWLEDAVPRGSVTEISGADYLQQLRSRQRDYMGLSFAAISASGPNGAVVHYRPSEETNRPITTSDVYLIDSGGQYKDGTTDVTRTVHFGQPTDYQRETYTLVLMGAINEFLQVFKQGTFGIRLDQAARAPLFSYGLEYGHGTGHGLGSFLNVHEDPYFRGTEGVPVGEEGTFITIEPGYYEDGQFGIRLETLAMVKEADTKYNFNGRTYLTFEPVTLVPFQEKMIKFDMMNENQLTWLNDYHRKVRETIGPELQRQGKNDVYDWLMKNTQSFETSRISSGAKAASSVFLLAIAAMCSVFST